MRKKAALTQTQEKALGASLGALLGAGIGAYKYDKHDKTKSIARILGLSGVGAGAGIGGAFLKQHLNKVDDPDGDIRDHLLTQNKTRRYLNPNMINLTGAAIGATPGLIDLYRLRKHDEDLNKMKILLKTIGATTGGYTTGSVVKYLKEN
jgi:hypothetical protein